MKRFLILMLLASLSLTVRANQVPTLVPPTPVPQPESGVEEILPSISTIARIAETGKLRIGVLYNAPPFSELNIRGEISGFDADLMRLMAETWDVEIEFVQITRDTATAAHLLRTGELDLLVGAMVHRRELDSLVEFSQTYFLGQQAMMVRTDDAAALATDLVNRRIGVVVATPAHSALVNWMNLSNINAQVTTFLTLDQAYSALVNNEVDGIVDHAYRLAQVAAVNPELTQILPDAVDYQPYAIGILRQDVIMRNLVNQTLQHLTLSGDVAQLYQQYFPGANDSIIQIWSSQSESAPTLAVADTQLPFPSQYVVPNLSSNGLRITGLHGITADNADAPESERRLDTFHRALFTEMANRWNVPVNFEAASPEDAIEQVSDGEADIAVGLTLDWIWADQIDFSGPYLFHGERMMVRFDDDINSFIGLRGGSTVVTPSNEATAAARVVEIAELPNVNARIDDISQQREQDLAFALLADEDLDADAVFGDSLKLIPHVQANPEDLRLTLTDDGKGRWYSTSNRDPNDFAPMGMVMGLPLNDIEFRLWVNYTLQDMARDGTLVRLLEPLMMPEDVPTFEVWP